MAAGIGSLIEAVDYNTIRTIVGSVFGVGGTNPETNSTDRSFGYGQVMTSSPVAANNTITSSQWSQLRTDMARARQHQTGTGVKSDNATDGNSLLIPTAGSVITNEFLEQYLSFSFNLIENRFNIAPSQSSVESPTPSSVQFVGAWAGRLQHEITIVGSSTSINPLISTGDTPKENLRFFFNAGGKIKLSANRIGGSASSKNSAWTALLCGMGEIIFGPNSTVSSNSFAGSSVGSTPTDPVATASCSVGPGSSGPGLETNIGWNDLTTDYQLVFQKYADEGIYSSNNYQVHAKTNADYSELKLRVTFADDDTGRAAGFYTPYTYDEVVDGTVISNISFIRPSGTNVSVPAPQANLGTLVKVTPTLPTYVNVTTGSSGTASPILTLNRPAGISVGTLMIAFMNTQTRTGIWSAPAGWTKAKQQLGEPEICIMHKVATSADLSATSYNFGFQTYTVNNVLAGCIIAYNNAEFGNVGTFGFGNQSNRLIAPSTYANGDNSVLLSYFADGDNARVIGEVIEPEITRTTRASVSSASPSFKLFSETVSAGSTGVRSTPITVAETSNSGAVLVSISGKIS
jgi:hypothetical protein